MELQMRNKTKNQRFYRRPRTTQERRANGKRSKWGRARRNQANLVDWHDDRCACVQKTWKVKRRHQYRDRARGQQHTIFLPHCGGASWRFWVNTWELAEWFDNHDIPYRLEKVEKIEKRIETHQRVYKRTGWRPYTTVQAVRPRNNGAKKTQTQYVTRTSWEGVYNWVRVKLAKPRIARWSTLVGYNLTWWSDKDIGIDHIIEQSGRLPM
jgi:hypothetical protein